MPKLSSSSADVAALHGALPQPALPKRPPHKAAPVERPVTRRFKLQQSSSIRVSIKLKKPLGSSGLSTRLSTLRHQRKRQATEQSPDASQTLHAPLCKKAVDVAAQASDTQPSASRASDTQPQPSSAESAPAQDHWQQHTPAAKTHASDRLHATAFSFINPSCKGSSAQCLTTGPNLPPSHHNGSHSGHSGQGGGLLAESKQGLALLHSRLMAAPQSSPAKAAQTHKGSMQNSPTDNRAALPSSPDATLPAAAMHHVPQNDMLTR